MFSGKNLSIFHLIRQIFQYYRHLCISAFEMQVTRMARHYFALVGVLQSWWAMKPIRNLIPSWETKSSSATTTFNMEYMPMGVMNRFLVWTSENVGVFIKAETAIVEGNTVSFKVGDKVVRSFPKDEFLKHNKMFYALENTN